ncbi:hypothetical protein OH77DRAFT_1375126, partial [Trametes cingulata]
QHKLAQVEAYCGSSFLTINVAKTLAAAFGPLPDPLPPLWLYSNPLIWVAKATYVGMTFCSTSRNIFARHYERKSITTRQISNATYSLESYIGSLPPNLACALYKAWVDPHLTAGCEVALAITLAATSALEKVQLTYLRRALRLGLYSQIAPLFSETSIWPISYCRLALALGFLAYLLREQPALPLAALRHAHALAVDQHPSWWGDLLYALRTLPLPVLLSLSPFPTADTVSAALLDLSASLAGHLRNELLASVRLPLIHARLHHSGDTALNSLCVARAYLSLPRRLEREALTQLLSSDHPLAIEALRRVRPPVPRHHRVCRFCCLHWAVEDEPHALLEC